MLDIRRRCIAVACIATNVLQYFVFAKLITISLSDFVFPRKTFACITQNTYVYYYTQRFDKWLLKRDLIFIISIRALQARCNCNEERQHRRRMREGKTFSSDLSLSQVSPTTGDRGKDSGRVPHVGPCDSRGTSVPRQSLRRKVHHVEPNSIPFPSDLGTRKNLVHTHYFRYVFPKALRRLRKQGAYDAFLFAPRAILYVLCRRRDLCDQPIPHLPQFP